MDQQLALRLDGRVARGRDSSGLRRMNRRRALIAGGLDGPPSGVRHNMLIFIRHIALLSERILETDSTLCLDMKEQGLNVNQSDREQA